jgi:hypothetical protein
MESQVRFRVHQSLSLATTIHPIPPNALSKIHFVLSFHLLLGLDIYSSLLLTFPAKILYAVLWNGVQAHERECRLWEKKKAKTKSKSSWPQSASDRLLLVKLVPTFAYRGCHMVSVTDPYGNILGFLDRSRYFFFQVAPQLYSRGWVDPVPDPLLLRKSGKAGNRTRTSGYVARNSDH